MMEYVNDVNNEIEATNLKLEEAVRNHQYVLEQQKILDARLKSSDEEIRASHEEIKTLKAQLQDKVPQPIVDGLVQDYEAKLREKDAIMAQMERDFRDKIRQLEEENRLLRKESKKNAKLVDKYEEKIKGLETELENHKQKWVIQGKIYSNQVFNALKYHVGESQVGELRRLVNDEHEAENVKVQLFKTLFQTGKDPADAATDFVSHFPELRKNNNCTIL